MKGKTLGLIAALVVLIAGAGFYIHSYEDTSTSAPDFTPRLLSRLGAMDCYTFNETVKVIDSNVSLTSTVMGGFYNGTYFFHGRRNGTEWWTVVSGRELVQRISINGSTKVVKLNLTQDQYSLVTTYDPVKLALRAVGAGKEISGNGNSRKYQFTIKLAEDVNALMSGNLTVWVDGDFYPVRIVVDSIVFTGDNTTSTRLIEAEISPKCSIPEWVKELEG